MNLFLEYMGEELKLITEAPILSGIIFFTGYLLAKWYYRKLLNDLKSQLSIKEQSGVINKKNISKKNNNFLEHAGVKFKIDKNNKIDKTTPYCPLCDLPTPMFKNYKMPRAIFECSICGFKSTFTVRQLEYVTRDI